MKIKIHNLILLIPFNDEVMRKNDIFILNYHHFINFFLINLKIFTNSLIEPQKNYKERNIFKMK